MKVNNSKNYVALKAAFNGAFDDALGCVFIRYSKTLYHYSLKALQIYQNHLRSSFYVPDKIKKEKMSKAHLLFFEVKALI